ncbi:RNA methyltransferase, RsmE family protein [Mycobacteroides abscessus subsp. bolletii 1513]|uniref:Ribosomal RNA small subunit methyltransferase E n=1 Tax=Mycobacteroides abscessus subsp. bolletii 1513 TaxID=1299321 RepID=X8DVV1_9MYCO|nr:RNA methyltransferase, RsmE family protein [Mycobacteroides abscessus subsp. bolletii 1513]
MAAATIFYVPRVPSAGEQVLLDGDEGHHAARVLRMRVGEPVMVCDGAGEVGDGVVASVDRTGLAIDVTGRWSVAAVDPKVTVVQALPKSDRSELAVDLAVEAGADEVIPWQAQRCVSRWDAHKAEKGRRRWEAVAQAASRQSRRAYVPSVPELHSTAQLAELVGARAADGAVVLVLHESAESGLGALAARLSSASSVVLIVGPKAVSRTRSCGFWPTPVPLRCGWADGAAYVQCRRRRAGRARGADGSLGRRPAGAPVSANRVEADGCRR